MIFQKRHQREELARGKKTALKSWSQSLKRRKRPRRYLGNDD